MHAKAFVGFSFDKQLQEGHGSMRKILVDHGTNALA